MININLNNVFKYKEWLEIIILKKGNDLLGIYEKIKKK